MSFFKKQNLIIKRLIYSFLFFFFTYSSIGSLFLFLNQENIYKNPNSIYNEIKNIKENKDEYINKPITTSSFSIFSFYYKINSKKENVQFCPVFKKDKIIEKNGKYLTTICLDGETKLHLEFIPSVQIFHPIIIFVYLMLAIISVLVIYFSNRYFFLEYNKDIIQSYLDNIKNDLGIDFDYILNLKEEKELLNEIRDAVKKIKKEYFPNFKLIKNIIRTTTIILIDRIRQKDYNAIGKFVHIKHFYWDLINVFDKYKLNELTSYTYYNMQTLVLEHYIVFADIVTLKEKTKYWFKIFSNLFNLTTTKYWTSEFQLLIFIIIFTFINSIGLGIIINSHNLWTNYYETMSILSNLGGNVEFKSALGIIYGVYLQIIGVIFFGILINIIGKKINT